MRPFCILLTLCISVLLLASPAAADPAAGRGLALANACAACHGPDGRSQGAIPSIDGLAAEDFIAVLKAFRADTRQGTVMRLIAKGLDDADMAALAAVFCDSAKALIYPWGETAMVHLTSQHASTLQSAPGMTRRRLLGLASQLPLVGAFAHRAWGQTPSRVIVVGGGFGGATCAKYIRRADAAIDVTLVEPHREFVTCPFSNAVLAGLRDMASVTYRYDILQQRYGVRVIHATAAALDPTTRRVTLDNGSVLPYDRLVLAPGIELRWGALEGYDAAASEQLPPCLAGWPPDTAPAPTTRCHARRRSGGDCRP